MKLLDYLKTGVRYRCYNCKMLLDKYRNPIPVFNSNNEYEEVLCRDCEFLETLYDME